MNATTIIIAANVIFKVLHSFMGARLFVGARLFLSDALWILSGLLLLSSRFQIEKVRHLQSHMISLY